VRAVVWEYLTNVMIGLFWVGLVLLLMVLSAPKSVEQSPALQVQDCNERLRRLEERLNRLEAGRLR